MRIPTPIRTFCLVLFVGAAMQVAPYICSQIGDDSPKIVGSPLIYAKWGGYTSPERARFRMDDMDAYIDLGFWLYMAFGISAVRWANARSVSRRIKRAQLSP